MAYSAIGRMVPTFYVCICFLSFWHAHCKAFSEHYHSNAEDIYEQFFMSKSKVGKQHRPPSSAHLKHPPAPPKPPSTRPGQPAPISTPAPPKSPSSRPGQPAPLSMVESEAAFSLYYGRNFKVVQNFFYSFSYLLLKESGDVNEKDWDLNISVFQDPLTNFTIDTSLMVGFLELLGCVGKLIGVPTSFGVASPCVWQLISQGGIPTIEVDNNLIDLNATSANKSFEALFGSSNKYRNPQLFSNEENQSNYISFDSSMDRGPLQRAEWIKFLASFFDLEERANNIYGQIQSNYQCLNTSSKGANTSKPLVAWLSYNTDLGVWTFSNDPYKLQLILDAGGINLDLPTLSMTFSMSNQSSVDSFHMIASTLHVVIDETYAPDPSAYTLINFTTSANISDINGFPFLANKRHWRYDKRVGINNALAWMEDAIAQPQIVLRDLIEVFYPALDGQTAYNTTYFRNIAMEESFVNTSSLQCLRPDMTSAMQPTIIPCSIDSVF